MRFIETHVFTRLVLEFWSDDEYRLLQMALLLRPALGPLIPRSGGLRKVRWSQQGTGKRGGVRVIYYWDKPSETIYMLYAYQKSVQGDLSAQQVKTLRQLVKEEFK